MLLEGSSQMALILLPPLLLVFGATFGAAAAGSTIGDLRRLGHWARLALTPERVPSMTDRIAVLVDLAGKARREGLLALDRQLGDVRDPFLRRGLRLAVDGTDPDRCAPPSKVRSPPCAPRRRSPRRSSRGWPATRRPSGSSAPSSG